LPGADSNSELKAQPRRWTILAAGLLLVALSLVVLYTSHVAFFSPIALVVVAAIGLAALLLQLRLRQGLSATVRAPLWLNIVGSVFAIAAVFADMLHLSANVMLLAALGAVAAFAISGIIVLGALRKPRA
jgi:cation transport ATPase